MLQAYDRRSLSAHQLRTEISGTVKFGNDHVAKIIDLEVAFRQHTCFIRNLDGVDLLTGSRGNNFYTLSLQDMMASSPICLLSKASKTKSWLWHHRLSHLNFGAINHLARQGLVRSLPKFKFEKDHFCLACAMGKSKKKSHKPKSEDNNQEKLYLLHMDLCGPMRVESVNGKKYILVIVDDYSRFIWVKCLRSKDEAPDFIIKFLKMIQEGPEEYEDDETEDGPVDYPMDGGDDGDDDDDDSSGDDVKDEDEDEEEEHLALADSAVVIPTVELVSLPEGTEPVIPPPSTDTTTTGARITVWLHSAISLLPEAEVERLIAMHTLPPSPLTSLSPPFTGERLARCTTPSAHSSPPPIPSPLLPSSGYPTQIQTLRMASTHPFIDAVTAALPSPPLPPLPPPLYIPPPVDCRDDIPETEMPPRKRSCLFALGSRDTWVDPAEAVPKIAPMTFGEINTRRVDFLMEDRIAYQETILIMEEEAYVAREAWAHSIGLSVCTRVSAPCTSDTATAAGYSYSDITPEILRVMGDMRREMGDMQAELLALREQQRRARQPGLDARVKFATCTLLDYALTWWNSQIRSLGTDAYAMTWEVKGKEVPTYTKRFQELTLICTKFVANETEKIDNYISGLLDNIFGSVKSSKHKTLDETIELANVFMDQKLRTYAKRQTNNKQKDDDSSRNNHGHQQQPAKRQNVAKVYNIGSGERKPYGGNLPKCTKFHFHHNGLCTQKCHKCNKVGHFARDCRSSGNTNVAYTQRDNRAIPKGNGCFECEAP
uniref:Integrase, catalytic region, zinc finger, CCHC-type, peptidase aspartic, catalytic n=1 Tax=Tanacetum cinerariifolium TaxID=118510 RepID=A0A6L2NXT4_TANCI|nr:integrase, catalytic region, zinc finger, CCHC-type, peptidase aspartic, catalytic [Tanacetum cinerariifolium]